MKQYIIASNAHGNTKTFYFETLEEAMAYANKIQKNRKKSISVYKIHNVEEHGRYKYLFCSQEYNTKNEYYGYNADGTPVRKANIRFIVDL